MQKREIFLHQIFFLTDTNLFTENQITLMAEPWQTITNFNLYQEQLKEK